MVQRDSLIIFELPACFSHVIPEPEVDSGQMTELVRNINSSTLDKHSIPDLFVPFACLHVCSRGISPSVQVQYIFGVIESLTKTWLEAGAH